MASSPLSPRLPSRPSQPSQPASTPAALHPLEPAASPLSPPRLERTASHMRSPNTTRRLKKDGAFPREQLWTWHGDGADLKPQSPEKLDAIESILRESALSSLATVPTLSVASPSDRPRATLASAHVHHPLQPPYSPLSPPATASSVVSPPSTASPMPPLTASKRKLGKTNTHSALRVSSRNLTSPPSTAGGGRDGEGGWKTFKMAQRTNRLIAKTRKVLEVLHRNNDSTRKLKLQDVSEGRTGVDEATLNQQRSEAEDGDMPTEDSESELGTSHTQRLTAQQMFERDVCGDDDSTVSTDQPWLGQSSSNNNNSGVDGVDEFWRIYQGARARPDSARSRYITNCEEKSLLVLPVLNLKRPSRYNPSTKTLRFDNYYLGDDRAEAVGDALHLLPVPVNHLSMKNVGVTSPGSTAIVNGLPLKQLQHLSFAENLIGTKGAMTIFHGLRDPQVNLKTLDLGNNRLGDQAVHTLMQCLVNRCTLEHLDLRKNNIYHAAKAIGELLRITTPLRSLNLSWNNIRGEPAQYLAKCMMENITLTALDLSDNTLGNNGNADAELGACLATNKSLKRLDVSSNHIHGKSVLVYVNGLQQNTTLETLVIRGNPIGNLGTEAILRCVASGAIAKCEVDIGDCNVEIHEQTVIYGGGSYALSLSERADAILLRELLLLNWKGKTEITDAAWNGTPYTFNRKDEKTFISTFPSTGVMQLKVQPNYDRHEDLISASGLVRIERLLQRSFGAGRDGDEAAKLFCMRLLAEEYAFSVDHANALLALFQTHTSQVEKASAAALLIPQIRGSKLSCVDTVHDCASMAVPDEFFEDKDKDGKIDVCGDICMVIGLKNLSDVEQAHVEKRVGKWISFNVLNATGHYRLNMANPIDRRILTRILETNRHEKKLRTHYKLLDTSQHGQQGTQPLGGGFRNVKLNHVPVVASANWQFPRVGIFEFDFVQTKRPYALCTALSDAAFEKFLREFKQLDVDAETKLIGLRSISSLYYFNCGQAQRLMEHFGTFERHHETGTLFRAEVFIILFSRLVDEWNFGETLALLDLATKQQVVERLGHLHCFHPLQVAESYGPLQLAVYDHRQLVLLLVRLASSGEAELTNVVLNNETVVAADEWKSWQSDDRLPPQGVLSCAMRSVNGLQSEAQLPATSTRKKMIQTLLLKFESRAQELL